MFSLHKNSYLQCQSSGINPRIINHAVDFARNNLFFNQTDPCFATKTHPTHNASQPPLLKLSSTQPYHPAKHVDVTRRPLAFGVERQVKKLRKELHDRDNSVVLAALTSLLDILHDPEAAYMALNLDMLDILTKLLDSSSKIIRERCCIVVNLLASVADADLIMRNITLVLKIRMLLNDDDQQIRFKTALVVRTMSAFWRSADVLLEKGFIPTILDGINRTFYDNDKIEPLLDCLNSLMYNLPGKQAAFEHNAFEILIKHLADLSEEEIVAKTLRALASLLYLPECNQLALSDNIDLLKTLVDLLTHVNPDVHNAAAEAVMFITLKSKAKMMTLDRFLVMPKRLIDLAGNCHNETSQIFSIRGLINICDYPPLRLFVYSNYIKIIEAIPVKSAFMKRHKDILVDIVSNVGNLGQVFYEPPAPPNENT